MARLSKWWFFSLAGCAKPGQTIFYEGVFMTVRIGNCWYCGRECTRSGQTRDHVVPRSEGGRGVTVLACGRCNRLKASLSVEEFRLVLAYRRGKIGSAKEAFQFWGEEHGIRPDGLKPPDKYPVKVGWPR